MTNSNFERNVQSKVLTTKGRAILPISKKIKN